MTIFSIAGCLAFVLFLLYPYRTNTEFYFFSSILGFAFGTWVVGATMLAEMFGTNVRATAATTIPNFCRGSVILMNGILVALKPIFGIHTAVTIVGAGIFMLALGALYFVKDTYGRELNYTNTA